MSDGVLAVGQPPIGAQPTTRKLFGCCRFSRSQIDIGASRTAAATIRLLSLDRHILEQNSPESDTEVLDNHASMILNRAIYS